MSLHYYYIQIFKKSFGENFIYEKMNYKMIEDDIGTKYCCPIIDILSDEGLS